MKRILTALAILLALAGTAHIHAAAPEPPVWEYVAQSNDADESGTAAVEMRREAVEVSVRDGVVFITVDKPITVQVYSILGQLVTSRRVEHGTVRLTLGRHGVYILKAGGVTRRISV